MIEVKNLTKSYVFKGKRLYVFKDLNFKVDRGNSVALLGKNGAGKSTLLRLIGGIDQPDSGSITADCSVSWPVGLIGGFQGSLSARENVTFVSKIYSGSDSDSFEEKVERVAEFADIGSYFEKPFKTYSSGMAARVTFGLSMAFNFDVYLLDEVTGAGDAKFREKCKKILKEKQTNSDFIMVNHNLWGLKFNCDKALLLDNGKIMEFDSLKDGIKEHKRLLGIN